jgi:hypothetical protein
MGTQVREVQAQEQEVKTQEKFIADEKEDLLAELGGGAAAGVEDITPEERQRRRNQYIVDSIPYRE